MIYSLLAINLGSMTVALRCNKSAFKKTLFEKSVRVSWQNSENYTPKLHYYKLTLIRIKSSIYVER